jgi:hypothetical protein
MLTKLPLTLAERYPNVRPRIMTPVILAKEGKAILCIGPDYGPYGGVDYAQIWTEDGRGVREAHLIDKKYLTSDIQQ